MKVCLRCIVKQCDIESTERLCKLCVIRHQLRHLQSYLMTGEN